LNRPKPLSTEELNAEPDSVIKTGRRRRWWFRPLAFALALALGLAIGEVVTRLYLAHQFSKRLGGPDESVPSDPSREFVHDEEGYYSQQIDLRTFEPGPLELKIEVSRLFRENAIGRFLGIALYPLEFSDARSNEHLQASSESIARGELWVGPCMLRRREK
jgi:hypothetical protein